MVAGRSHGHGGTERLAPSGWAAKWAEQGTRRSGLDGRGPDGRGRLHWKPVVVVSAGEGKREGVGGS